MRRGRRVRAIGLLRARLGMGPLDSLLVLGRRTCSALCGSLLSSLDGAAVVRLGLDEGYKLGIGEGLGR